MDDLFIIFSPAQLTTAITWLGRIHTVIGLPKAADHIGANCEQLPLSFRRVEAYAVIRRHPTDGRGAIKVDAVIRFVRNHPRLIDFMTNAQATALRALVDGAVALDASWSPSILPT
jgi:hypothetical protein